MHLPHSGETMKNLNMITLGRVLHEIQLEGNKKGKSWKVARLYVTRHEQSPKNIQRKLAELQKKDPLVTENEAKTYFPFPYYRNKEDHWRVYYRDEAEDLKKRIKKMRRYVA